MSFIGSSDRWGDEACARLCEIIMEANDGMTQQIIENRTDLLDLKSKEELEIVDDFGLTLPYLAVYYDRPDMIKYLVKRGLDMTKPCDGVLNFGTPMFYAVNLGKLEVIEALNTIGCSVNADCDTFLKFKPEYYAARIDNQSVKDKIYFIQGREVRAATLLKRSFLKYRWHKLYNMKRAAIVCIQRYIRGFLDRAYVRSLRDHGGEESLHGGQSLLSAGSVGSSRSHRNHAEADGEGDDEDDDTHSGGGDTAMNSASQHEGSGVDGEGSLISSETQ